MAVSDSFAPGSPFLAMGSGSYRLFVGMDLADPASLFMWGAARVHIAFYSVGFEAAVIALHNNACRHPSPK